MYRLTALTFAACVVAQSALSQTVALVVSNESYDAAGVEVAGSRALARSARGLSDAGVEVFARTDAVGPPTIEAFVEFSRTAEEAGSAIAILSGAFAHTAFDSWLIPNAMERPRLSGLVQRGLPVSAVMSVLDGVDGPAMMIIASDEEITDLGPFLTPGLGEIDAPDDLLVVRTDPETANRIVREVLLRGDGSLQDALRRFGEIASDGNASERLLGMDSERSAWDDARETDTVEAYTAFLDRYPEGDFKLEAQLRLYQLERDPARQAEREEAALSLTRAERQAVQGNLSVLGYNTRGIDGIFGGGTRGAIEDWQGDNDYTANGYLTGSQIDVLARQAKDQMQEQEREAERRGQQDRDWWQQTGETGTVQGYLQYLERYPDGRFSELARSRLDELQRDAGVAEGQERDLWNRARENGTAQAYRAYLDSYPEGAFAAQARERLGALEGRDAAAAEAAAQAENALNLGALGRQLAEARLEELGLNPGTVDGQFDDSTRGAIRRFQTERGIGGTGYLDQATVAQLLAGGLQRLFE